MFSIQLRSFYQKLRVLCRLGLFKKKRITTQTTIYLTPKIDKSWFQMIYKSWNIAGTSETSGTSQPYRRLTMLKNNSIACYIFIVLNIDWGTYLTVPVYSRCNNYYTYYCCLNLRKICFSMLYHVVKLSRIGDVIQWRRLFYTSFVIVNHNFIDSMFLVWGYNADNVSSFKVVFI